MEIQNTLLPGVSPSFAEGQQQPQQAPPLGGTGPAGSGASGPPAVEPAGGEVEPAVQRAAAPAQTLELAQAIQTGDNSSLLTSGEKEILNLLFSDQGWADFTVYGSEPSRPATLGNFLDVRG